MKEQGRKPSQFDEQLIKLLAAVDNQIARELQRTPGELSEHGVRKWEPFRKRIEMIASSVLDGLGDNSIRLDSILVFAQAMTKVLTLTVEELGQEGLGKVRGEYCLSAVDNISRDAHRALQRLRNTEELM